MKNIITIQHTQSVHHTNGMVGSWTDWELTALGMEQAHRIGTRLQAELSSKPYVLYASDLKRAAQTAAIVGEHLGLTKEEILRGIAAYKPVGSRMHLIRGSEGRIIIDDCYNANPQAMAEAIRILGQTPCRRRVAVLGDMGELGELTAQAHRDMGECTNRCAIDAVIAIGPKAKAITETAKGQVYWFATKEEAYDTLREQFTAGTIVLVKASHAMEFGKIVAELEAVKDI